MKTQHIFAIIIAICITALVTIGVCYLGKWNSPREKLLRNLKQLESRSNEFITKHEALIKSEEKREKETKIMLQFLSLQNWSMQAILILMVSIDSPPAGYTIDNWSKKVAGITEQLTSDTSSKSVLQEIVTTLEELGQTGNNPEAVQCLVEYKSLTNPPPTPTSR